LKAAQLEAVLRAAIAGNPGLDESWTTVEQWSEQSRYASYSKEEAESLMTAISHERFGVLPWIQQHW
jgi:hypothetical protein